MYQEKLRNKVNMYVLAPMTVDFTICFEKYLKALQTTRQFEIIIPVITKDS